MRSFFNEMRDWIDAETRAMLCPESPRNAVEVGIEAYSILLLHQGADRPRIDEIVTEIQREFPPRPNIESFVVGERMALDDAIAGQFALACCDCIAAFVRDELVENFSVKVFRRLHHEVLHSPEFQSVEIEILEIPTSEAARRFCWQFCGIATGLRIPARIRAFRKKARLMEHWAPKAGIRLTVCD